MSCCRVDWGLPIAAGRCLFSRLPPGFPVVPQYLGHTSVVPQPLTEPDKRLSHIRLFTQTFSFGLTGFMCAFAFTPIRGRFVLTVFSRLESCLCFFFYGRSSAGTFHSTGISRVIATPVPVPLQRPHLNHSCYVAHTYSGPAAQEGLCTPGLLHDCCSTRCCLKTPGARQSLSIV